MTSKEVAGPSIILSYITASGAAVLAALSYAEFATAMPVAGGAFNYIKATFGELAAWTVGWNMILETLLSSSAVSHYFFVLIFLSLCFCLQCVMYEEGLALHRVKIP